MDTDEELRKLEREFEGMQKNYSEVKEFNDVEQLRRDVSNLARHMGSMKVALERLKESSGAHRSESRSNLSNHTDDLKVQIDSNKAYLQQQIDQLTIENQQLRSSNDAVVIRLQSLESLLRSFMDVTSANFNQSTAVYPFQPMAAPYAANYMPWSMEAAGVSMPSHAPTATNQQQSESIYINASIPPPLTTNPIIPPQSSTRTNPTPPPTARTNPSPPLSTARTNPNPQSATKTNPSLQSTTNTNNHTPPTSAITINHIPPLKVRPNSKPQSITTTTANPITPSTAKTNHIPPTSATKTNPIPSSTSTANHNPTSSAPRPDYIPPFPKSTTTTTSSSFTPDSVSTTTASTLGALHTKQSCKQTFSRQHSGNGTLPNTSRVAQSTSTSASASLTATVTTSAIGTASTNGAKAKSTDKKTKSAESESGGWIVGKHSSNRPSEGDDKNQGCRRSMGAPGGGGGGYFNNYPDRQQLFVGNLPHHLSEDDVKNICSEYGNVLQVKINRGGNKQIGAGGRALPNYGFVVFESEDSVQSMLDQKPLVVKDPAGGQDIRLNVEEKKSKDAQARGPPRLKNS